MKPFLRISILSLCCQAGSCFRAAPSKKHFIAPRSQAQNDSVPSMERRLILSSTSAALFSFLLTTQPDSSHAAQTTGEAIRRSAANIPGYGQADVFYPPAFVGRWKVSREIVSLDSAPPEQIFPFTIEYEMRFLASDDGAVVADRGFNQASYEDALLLGKDTSSFRVRSYDWTTTNPNVLTMTYYDGSRKEIKVTKRATEKTEDTVSSSEFQRIAAEKGERGIPLIAATRTLTKWKVGNERFVDGIEIVYSEGLVGDPMKLDMGASSGPKIISKSRLRLEKMT